MSGDLKDMRAYSRGYEDGRRSKDADHAAVVLKLSRLTFNGNHHENLSKIAHAVYPCATGWTCESSKGLRDRLIDLLGGVHDHCDSGRGCTCGDPNPRDVGEPAKAMTYDVLGNERSKAIANLREWEPDRAFADDNCGEVQIRILYQLLGLGGAMMMDGADAATSVRDRLIHLLGGSRSDRLKGKACDFVILDELGGKSEGAQVVAEPNSQESPNLANSGVDDGGKVTITTELRECIETATKTYEGSWYEMNDADHTICHITEGELLGIADRMERRFSKALISRGTKLGCYKLRINQLEAECDQMQAECDRLTAALDELHADPANDVICRLERERDKAHAKVLRLEFENAEWRRGAERDADKLESLTGAYNDAVAERDDLLELLKDAVTEYQLSQNGWAYGAVVSETITLESENNELRAKLEEADAAIANWRERERSFEESERERDELRRSLRQIAERAGVPHDRDLSEYGDGQIANAVIGQLGDTNQYVKSLEWVRDRRLPRIESERDELQKRLDEMREQREHWASEATKIYRLFFPHEEYGMPNEPSEMIVHKINELQAKLDAIREALDGNH